MPTLYEMVEKLRISAEKASEAAALAAKLASEAAFLAELLQSELTRRPRESDLQYNFSAESSDED
jgi:hypothetical protein